jgi:uncharacterized membrane protein YphA (DoxX/SURF4 family)
MATMSKGKPVGAGRNGGGAARVGLRVLALMLGVFLIFEGLGKLAWLIDSGPLSEQLAGWLKEAPASSRWYLETFAIPGIPMFARLVVLGELLSGAALVAGFWTRMAAALAFLMVLNFHFASGRIFAYSFLTNGYGLPVLGGLLALAIGGGRLPFSASR